MSTTSVDFQRLAAKRKQELAFVGTNIDLLDVELPSPKPVEPSKERHIYQVRRVRPQDVNEIGDWLIKRLSAIWPNVSLAGWASKTRAWMSMNDASFVRTDNVIGLAVAQRDDMDGLCRVYERFVVGRELSTRLPNDSLHQIDAEILSIYRTMRDWARSKDAIRFNVLIHSDLTESRFEKYLGWNLSKRNEYVVRLGK